MRQESNTGSCIMVQRRGLARGPTVRGLFTALTAVGAFIKIVIPVGADTMNFTPQRFSVFLVGLLPGFRRASLSMSAYPLIGLARIPILVRGGGLSYLMYSTLGLLPGPALVAYVIGKSVKWMYAVKPGVCLFSATVGYVIHYGMRILCFYFITHLVAVAPDIVGWGVTLAAYCLPTATPDYILYILAVMVAKRLCPSVGRLME